MRTPKKWINWSIVSILIIIYSIFCIVNGYNEKWKDGIEWVGLVFFILGTHGLLLSIVLFFNQLLDNFIAEIDTSTETIKKAEEKKYETKNKNTT